MALAGRNEIRIDVELIAFDADFAVDDRLAARMVGETQGDFGLFDIIRFLSIAIKKFRSIV
jgi:poly-beta-hydroxyalkanoate depolymerase